MNLFNTILVLFIYFLIKIQCVCSKTNFSKACDEMDSVSLLEACQQFAAGFLFPHAALEQVKMHFSREVWKAAWVARVDLLQPFISFTASALSFFSVCMQNLFFFLVRLKDLTKSITVLQESFAAGFLLSLIGVLTNVKF